MSCKKKYNPQYFFFKYTHRYVQITSYSQMINATLIFCMYCI